MVGHPYGPPTTYRKQEIVQEEFKEFSAERAGSSAGRSTEAVRTRTRAVHTPALGRKYRGNTEFQQTVESFSDTLTYKRNIKYVCKILNRNLPNMSHLTPCGLAIWCIFTTLLLFKQRLTLFPFATSHYFHNPFGKQQGR